MLKFFQNLKNCQKGFTLVEIIVVISIIALFSAILVSDFPKIQRQFALSSATYKLAQDLRRVQDLGLSGVQVADRQGDLIAVKGYGIYINLAQSAKKYILYADVNGDQKYSGDTSFSLCSQLNNPASDCTIEVVDISKENSNLYIKQINNITGNFTSINFSPPNPTITLNNLASGQSQVGIVLSLKSDVLSTRAVWVNTSGLINVK